MSRMNLSDKFIRDNVVASEYVGHATIFSWMFTIARCLVAGLGLGLDLVSGW